MKKTFAIFFLALFLFNVGGYFMVFWALHFHADQKLTTILDEGNLSREEMLELKVPLSMPYPIHPRGFQRVDESLELDGKYYKLVEQKLESDTLHVVVVRDMERERLAATMTDYANLSNDLPASTQKAFQVLGKFIKDYTPQPSPAIASICEGLSEIILHNSSSENLETRVEEIIAPPPRS